MRYFVISLVLFCLFFQPLRAQQGSDFSIVRDAEIEHILREWMTPVYKAAGLNPSSMRVILVPDDDINAFTAGGLDIFITTGLIMQATAPEEIIGVLAHETGHITGGHVLANLGVAKQASYETIISTVLGIGAGILTGNGQVANAVTSFGKAGALSGYLAHSRLQESAADQAALTFLQNSNTPAFGLVSFMEKLGAQDLLPPAQQRPFARTHPITRDRIAALQRRTQSTPNNQKLPAKNYDDLKRIQAKLLAFTNPSRALQKYEKGDDAITIMAQAIAHYRQNRITKALALADSWVSMEPDNAYAYELKAQILKEAGRPREAVPVYEKALVVAPREALIRIDAAHAMVEANDDRLLDKAIAYLNTGIIAEPRSGFAFRLLSTAYARKNMEPEAQIYLAELSVLNGDRARAKQLLAIARPKLKASSPALRRASDLKLLLDTLDRGKEDT